MKSVSASQTSTSSGWTLPSILASTVQGAPTQMPVTLLLIDDDAVQAATRQTILKQAGYTVIAVLSPQRALEQFRNDEFPAPIDLILTDHLMPGMSGSQFIGELREFAPHVPVLVISGLAEAEDEYHSLNVHFRTKPVPPASLLTTIHDLLLSSSPLLSESA